MMMMIIILKSMANGLSAVWFHAFHWPGKLINMVTRTHEVEAHVYVY
jgi:hypothetical protein